MKSIAEALGFVPLHHWRLWCVPRLASYYWTYAPTGSRRFWLEGENRVSPGKRDVGIKVHPTRKNYPASSMSAIDGNTQQRRITYCVIRHVLPSTRDCTFPTRHTHTGTHPVKKWIPKRTSHCSGSASDRYFVGFFVASDPPPSTPARRRLCVRGMAEKRVCCICICGTN